jgi:hypothetical protein
VRRRSPLVTTVDDAGRLRSATVSGDVPDREVLWFSMSATS